MLCNQPCTQRPASRAATLSCAPMCLAGRARTTEEAVPPGVSGPRKHLESVRFARSRGGDRIRPTHDVGGGTIRATLALPPRVRPATAGSLRA